MSTTKPGVLRRLSDRLTSPAHELEAAELRRESEDLGVSHIGDIVQRTRVTVSGEVRSVTLRPRHETPALDVELWDGSDSLHLIWLGRRRIAGIVPGIKIQATGRVTRQRKVTTIFNPAYEILGRVGQTHE
ncbi:OB-fold nucleic acid binding domain-containing protein [Humibacillus xanthopallidus]|uniref:ATP-dependent DNA helicase RecG n=1 Tax=Humibacillus xanthopallidus TaxID=412689 RepID=A0A543HHG4_9MICO|nr:OB-fold nucleic acid binding domain-containing protein [Humibacillus xanthopallidus]TQM57760.1 ATP-dependent DNA helicase RecG [Humibacillus xanthopallidus]